MGRREAPKSQRGLTSQCFLVKKLNVGKVLNSSETFFLLQLQQFELLLLHLGPDLTPASRATRWKRLQVKAIFDQKEISEMKLKIGKLKLKRAGHLAYPLTVGKLTVAIAIDVFCLTALLQRQLMYSCTGWLLHRLWTPRQHLQRLHHPVKYARELIRVKRGRDLT